MDNPPRFIVADRLADNRLWSEVLNLGGWDLIAKPFDAKEVLHIVTVACCFGGCEKNVTAPSATPSISVECPSETEARVRRGWID
jgi:hypothetical protein